LFRELCSKFKPKLFILISGILTLFLLGFLFFNLNRLNRNMDETKRTHDYLQDCDTAGHLIRKGSDILTNSVERYVITGNLVFRDRYFHEAKRDKNREAGLEKVRDFPNAEILRRDLNEAMRYSVELMSLEYHAMRLISTDADLASPNCPQEIRDYVLTEEEKNASPEARKEMACNIVFSLNYLTYKDHIYSSIDRSLQDAEVFLNQYRTSLTERYKVLYFYQLCTYAGFFLSLLVLVTFLILQRGRANAFLRKVLDNIPMLFSIKDARSERYVDCNIAFARYACRDTVAEVIGNTDAQIFDEVTANHFVEDDRKTLSGDVTNSFFENTLDAHGKPCSFLTTKLKISDMDGNTCLLGMSQDVTEAMEKQRSNEAIAEALLALQSYDAVSHPQKVIEVIRKRLNADFCHLIRFDVATNEAVVEPDCHAHLDPTTPCELVVAPLNDFRYFTRHSGPLEPFEIEEKAPLEILRMYAVLDAQTGEWQPTTTYSMPVNREGTLFGTLAIGYAMRRALSQFEKEFIETSVKILENALERQKTYSDLSAANARINREYDFVNSIFDIMPIPCVIKDVGNDFRCMRCNDAYAKLFQKPLSEIVDLNSADLFTPEIAQRLRAADQEAVRENKMIFEELVCTFPDGVEHTFLYRRGPMSLPDGRLVLFCVAEDITELRRQTDKVLQINERLQGEYQRAVNAEEAETFFAKSLKSILAMPPDQDAITPSIKEVGEYIGADRCFIYYRITDDEEKTGWELTYEWCGEGIEKKFKSKTDVDMFPDVCEALEHGEDFLATDIRSIHPVTCAWLQAQKVQSIIITPLRDENGSVFGFIGFDFVLNAQEQFSERIIRSVHEAADVILICRERNKRQATVFKAVAEEKLRSEIFESAAIPLLLFKPDGTIVTANSAALKAFGGSLSEVIGCKCHDFVCQLENRPVECPLRHPERSSQTFLLHRRDGQYFAIKTQTIRDDKGDPLYILECAVDMTETHELHENAEAIAQSLLALQSRNVISSPIQVLNIIRRRLGANTVYLAQYDRKTGVAFLNPEYTLLDNGETLAGRAEAGLDDLASFLDRLKDEGICEFEGSSRSLIRKAYVKRSPGINIPPSETIVMVPLKVRGESWGNLSITYAKQRRLGERDKDFFIRCREVLEAALERKLNDDDLHAALDKEIAAEKAKSFFFSSVSHDIRTPLNAIIGYSELLIGGISDEQERANALSAISTSGQTLLQLINDVLDLSKLEADRMVITPVLTDVRELASSVLHTFDVSVMNKPIMLKEEYGSLPLLEVDPQRIRQILFNLIGNAVKYTKRGEICVRASFRQDIGDENGVLVISVSDTGCGIADEDKEKLVNPFVQAGVDAKIKGTGLGLAICKQLAARMGGHFSFVSELGKGSTFALELRDVKCVERTPESQKKVASGQELIRLEMKREADIRKAFDTRAKSVAEQKPETRKDAKGNAPAPASVPEPGLKKQFHVLIADDVALNLSVLKALLARIGVRDVVKAVNGADAWDKIQATGKPFDIVLTDIWMPEMDGKEFVARVRADKHFADLPVYAVTADIEAQKDFVEHGFTGLLLKPVTIDKISGIFLKD
jgi:PAS domain S-box-containing protein